MAEDRRSRGLVLEAGKEGRLLQDFRVHAYLLDHLAAFARLLFAVPRTSGAVTGRSCWVGSSVSAGQCRRRPSDIDKSRTALVRRARTINRQLAETYPDAHIELDFTTPLELLVATILSAQSTDKRVNTVTPLVFARYPDAAAYAAADRTELEQMIMPTGFFRAKTDSLIKLGAALVERFDGEVPATLEGLDSLPGVGRKTANVVLGNAFGVPGITVDTHFGRLVRRFGWTTQTDPEQGRARGRRAVPAARTGPSSATTSSGTAGGAATQRNPACGACPVARWCPSYGEGETNPVKAAKLVREPRG